MLCPAPLSPCLPRPPANPCQLLLALLGLTPAAFQLKELQPVFLPAPQPSPLCPSALGQLWKTWRAVGSLGSRSPQLPLLPSSRCLEQEQFPSLYLWPAPSWHFLALSWLPGSALAQYPLQGQRALGPRAQAEPSRDWSRPAHPWQLHCGQQRRALALRSERAPPAPPPSTFWMTLAPCSMPWLTSWTPCWIELDPSAASATPSVSCSVHCSCPNAEAAPAAPRQW